MNARTIAAMTATFSLKGCTSFSYHSNAAATVTARSGVFRTNTFARGGPAGSIIFSNPLHTASLNSNDVTRNTNKKGLNLLPNSNNNGPRNANTMSTMVSAAAATTSDFSATGASSSFDPASIQKELSKAIEVARDMDKKHGLCTEPSQKAWNVVDEIYNRMQLFQSTTMAASASKSATSSASSSSSSSAVTTPRGRGITVGKKQQRQMSTRNLIKRSKSENDLAPSSTRNAIKRTNTNSVRNQLTMGTKLESGRKYFF